LGSIGEGFGRLLGVSWALFGTLWLFFRRSKTYLFTALVQDGLREAFWIDFGTFGIDLGVILGSLGLQVGAMLGEVGPEIAIFGLFWALLGALH